MVRRALIEGTPGAVLRLHSPMRARRAPLRVHLRHVLQLGSAVAPEGRPTYAADPLRAARPNARRPRRWRGGDPDLALQGGLGILLSGPLDAWGARLDRGLPAAGRADDGLTHNLPGRIDRQ